MNYETSTGFVLDSIETAIAFNNLHEGIHLGVIMALTKVSISFLKSYQLNNKTEVFKFYKG